MPISAQSASAFRKDFLDFTQALTWQRDIAWNWVAEICPICSAAKISTTWRASMKPSGARTKRKPCQVSVGVNFPLTAISLPTRSANVELRAIYGRQGCVPENVLLMRHLASQLSGRRPIELDSEKTYDFLARNTSSGNGLSISDEPSSALHHSVVCWRSEKTVENPRPT